MVINHIEKLFVTNDAATILRELEIQHPAAKIVVLASQMQEKQVQTPQLYLDFKTKGGIAFFFAIPPLVV